MLWEIIEIVNGSIWRVNQRAMRGKFPAAKLKNVYP
jgi:hypothetical protein